MKKQLLFLVALTVFSSSFHAQVWVDCDFRLLAENDYKCAVETTVADDIAVLRACRRNTVCFFIHGGTAQSYVWEAAGGEVIPDPNDPMRCCVAWGEGDNGYVQVTATYADGSRCQKSLMVILGESPVARCTTQPNYTVNIATPEIKTLRVCVGDTISLTDASLPGMSPITAYYWEYPGGSSTIPTTGFVPMAPGAYTIVHRVYNECGCYGEESIQLQVDNKCPFNLSCHGTVCGGRLETYSALNINCSDYVWDVTGGEILSGQHSSEITIQWGEPSSGYGVVYLDGGPCDCQCQSRKGVRIPIISDNVEIEGPDMCCEDEDYVFSLPLWGATEYTWSVTPSTNVVQSIFGTPNKVRCMFNEPGTYTIKAVFECPFLDCGPFSVTKQVTVRKKLAITPASPSDVCCGAAPVFTSSAGSATRWRVLLGGTALELDDSLGTTFTHCFDEPGFYTIEARCDGYCRAGSSMLHVLPRTPQPLDVSGPHEVCSNSAHVYDATSLGPDYIIEWAWVDDNGDTQRYWGSSVTIPFGNTAHDIILWQVDRRTGCRSLPLTYAVSLFSLQPWPYPSEIHVCDGQTLVLDRVEDQSDVVLYRWWIDDWQENPLLSIQDNPLKPAVTARVNYTTPHINIANLQHERRYCGQTETKILKIVADGVLAPPEISIPDPMCANIRAAWVIADATAQANIDLSQSYWLLDNHEQVPLLVPDTTYYTFTSSQTGQHTLRLHYVSRYGGCTVETQDLTVYVNDFPVVWIDASSPGQLCIQVAEGYNGTTYHWSTGETTRCIEHSSGDCSCVVSYGGCSRTLEFRDGGVNVGCVAVPGAFSVNYKCMNTYEVTINPDIPLPASLAVTNPSGDEVVYYAITASPSPQEIVIPFQGTVYMRLTWDNGAECYYCEMNKLISCVYKLDITRDCSTGEMIVKNVSTCTTANNIVCKVWDDNYNLMNSGYFNASDNVMHIPLQPDGSLYHVRIYDASDPSCYYEVDVEHGPVPAIAPLSFPSAICEDVPLLCTATATGDIVDYTWDFGDGSYNYGEKIGHVYKYGNYTITLTVTDRSGCTAACSTSVVVHKNYLRYGSIGLVSTIPACPGNNIQLQYHSELLNNNLNVQYTTTYQWFPSEWNMGNLNVAYVNQGGRVLVEETSHPGGCTYWADIYVDYPNRVTADISCETLYCKGAEVTLYGYAGPNRQYQWVVTDPDNVPHTSSQPDYTFTAYVGGQYTAQLTVIHGACTNSATATFAVQEVPVPNIGFSGNRCIGNGPVSLSSASGSNLNWSNGVYGTNALYYYAGHVGAYYRDPTTGCRSELSIVNIIQPPDMGALLTGCYNRCKKEIADGLDIPIYDCTMLSSGPWKWWGNGITIKSGSSCLLYPELLPIPSAGIYNLALDVCDNPNYCCTFQSPSLEINAVDCGNYTSQQEYFDNLPITVKYVEVTCTTENCSLMVIATMSLMNTSGHDLTIGSVGGCSIAGVSPSLPSILLNGNSMNLSLVLGFVPTGSYSINLYAPDGSLLGRAVVDVPNWGKCIESDECDLDIGVSMSLNTTRTTPGQTVYLDYTLTMPSSVSNVVAVWSDVGQVLWHSFSAPTATGTLVLDYGWLSQAAMSDDSVCLHVVSCQSGDVWCMTKLCFSAECLYNVALGNDCAEMQQFRGKTASSESQPHIPRMMLRPNPTTGKAEVTDAVTGVPVRNVKTIVVMSVLGQPLLHVEQTHSIDLTPLPSGTYIVTVYTSDGNIEHMKLTKK